MRTLWDFLSPKAKPTRKRPRKKTASRTADRPSPAEGTGDDRSGSSRIDNLIESLVARGLESAPAERPKLMRDRYKEVTSRLCRFHGVRVKHYRSSTSGVAVRQTDRRTGRTSVYIEAPEPKGPMSCAVFLHEVGHVAIGIGAVRPRCLEEYAAWLFAIRTMEAEGLNVTPAVRTRMDLALRYAVAKARRRGLKRLPDELAQYAKPARARASR